MVEHLFSMLKPPEILNIFKCSVQPKELGDSSQNGKSDGHDEKLFQW